MKAITLRESPVPVLLILLSLYGFVEYLHWKVVQHEDRVQVVRVPAALAAASGDGSEEAEPSDPGVDGVAVGSDGPVAGPLHTQSRTLAAAGRVSDALQRLDASLATEGKRDALRLEERGVLLLRLARPGEALADLAEAEHLGSSAAMHFFNQALARSRTGDLPGARQDLQRAIDLAPPAFRTRPMIALADLESTSPEGQDRARQLYRQVIELAPTEPDGYFGMGVLESRAGNISAAEKQYQAALDVRASFHKARYNLAILLLDSGRATKAAHHLEILAHEAPDPKVSFALARVRHALGDEAGAESTYKDAIRLARGRYPEAFFNLGLLLHGAGRNKEAEAAYRDALQQNPGNAAAWINLALLLADLKRGPEALEATARAVAANAHNEKTWFLRGRLLSQAGHRDEALAAYSEAARLRPGYTKAMLNAAVLHADMGHDGEAITLYRQVLALDPHNSTAWYDLGLALHRTGQDDEARTAYEEAVRADPEATNAAQNLGVLYTRAGRIEDARRVFAEALAHEPDDAGLRYNLALQLEKLGQTDAAIVAIERVIHLVPKHSGAWSALARLLAAQGRTEEAARARAMATKLESETTAQKGKT